MTRTRGALALARTATGQRSGRSAVIARLYLTSGATRSIAARPLNGPSPARLRRPSSSMVVSTPRSSASTSRAYRSTSQPVSPYSTSCRLGYRPTAAGTSTRPPAARQRRHPTPGPSYALWAQDLVTGERWQLHEQLWRCGGCDGPSGSAWSASGRYYVHIERGPRKRATLIDFTSRTVSDLTWSSECGPAIEWSPVADILFRNAGPDAIAITNLETGVEHIIPGLQPPGEFDATGRFVYATSGSGRDQGLAWWRFALAKSFSRSDLRWRPTPARRKPLRPPAAHRSN